MGKRKLTEQEQVEGLARWEDARLDQEDEGEYEDEDYEDKDYEDKDYDPPEDDGEWLDEDGNWQPDI